MKVSEDKGKKATSGKYLMKSGIKMRDAINWYEDPCPFELLSVAESFKYIACDVCPLSVVESKVGYYVSLFNNKYKSRTVVIHKNRDGNSISVWRVR